MLLENTFLHDFKVLPEGEYQVLELIVNDSERFLHKGTNFIKQMELSKVFDQALSQSLVDKDVFIYMGNPPMLLLSPYVVFNISTHSFNAVVTAMNYEFPLHTTNMENLFSKSFSDAAIEVQELKLKNKVERRFKTDVN